MVKVDKRVITDFTEVKTTEPMFFCRFQFVYQCKTGSRMLTGQCTNNNSCEMAKRENLKSWYKKTCFFNLKNESKKDPKKTGIFCKKILYDHFFLNSPINLKLEL